MIMTIEIGEMYKNINTGEVCIVRYKIFFNIAHSDPKLENMHPAYTHYKTFGKNWKRCGGQDDRKTGI